MDRDPRSPETNRTVPCDAPRPSYAEVLACALERGAGGDDALEPVLDRLRVPR